jgi:hypothetical protein
MARYAFDAFTRVTWATAIANIAAPTTAELNAGTDLSGFLAKDGLQTPDQQNMVDVAALNSNFDAQAVGTFGGPVQLKMFRDNDGTDAAWNLFVYGTAGFVVVRRGIASATAWAVAQKVEVYPAQMHQPTVIPSASNEAVKFMVTLPVTSTPNLKATVA